MSRSFFPRNYCSIFITGMTVMILIVDLWIPLGFGIWELYAIPLWLAFRTSNSPPRLIWAIAAMGSLFSVAEIPLSRPGGILLYAFFNRGLWALILCIAAVVLTTARKNEAAARQSEEQLRASEERYRLLTQAVPSMIYERYVNGGNFFYTDDWYEYTGLTPQQTVGDGWMQVLHPDDIERLRRRSVAERNPAIMHERRMRFRRKDGQYRWMLARSVPVRGENGEIVRRVGAITDIDDMVRAQNALRENEAQFRAMFEAAVVGQSQASAITGLFTRVNQRFCEMTGCSEAELLQMRPRDLLHPADVVHGLVPILEGNKDEIVREVRFMRKDGKVIWVNAAVRLLRDDDNKPMQTIAVYSDITRRKRAEEHRRRILDGLSLAQRIVAAGIWDFDLVTDEKYFSPAYYDLYGFHDTDEITFGRWIRCLIEGDRDRVAEAIRQLFKSGTDWNMEFRIEHPTRGQRWLASVGRVERAQDGKRVRFTGMDIDITERKQMEAQLQDYVNVLRGADRQKDEFLAMLGHELRNPLHAIRGAVDLLQFATSEQEVDTTCTIMDTQVTQMGRLIDDLLDVSRLTLNKLELRTETLKLTGILEDALAATRSAIAARELDLELSVQDDDLLLHADRVRLTQIFTNLISNAAKYTPKQGKIWVTLSHDAGKAVVSIRDNGVGIPAEKLIHLFDLFYQGHPSLEYGASGLGIGLTLARRLVELHGGRIEAHSEGADKGSEFLVYLPVIEREIAYATAQANDRKRESSTRRRILLVDDNKASTKLLAMALKNLHCEVETAYDGGRGIEMAATFEPEVVLLDLTMPGLDGYETCQRIRVQPWGKKIVLLAVTGWGGGETREHAKNAGFDELVTKPIKVKDILHLVDDLFEKRGDRQAALS